MQSKDATKSTPASLFNEAEADFLGENFLGRIATVSPSGQPHVVPVAYRFDGTSITFSGWNLMQSLKFKNLSANNRIAIVVDEVVSTRPWRARGIEVRGVAEPVTTEDSTYVKIIPRKVRSWGFKV